MAENGYYYKMAKKEIETYHNLFYDIVYRDFEDLDSVAEYLINLIEVKAPFEDDEAWEKETDKQRGEIYDLLTTEYQDTIDASIRIRTLYEIMREDDELMETFDDEPDLLLDYIMEVTPEALEKKYLDK